MKYRQDSNKQRWENQSVGEKGIAIEAAILQEGRVSIGRKMAVGCQHLPRNGAEQSMKERTVLGDVVQAETTFGRLRANQSLGASKNILDPDSLLCITHLHQECFFKYHIS